MDHVPVAPETKTDRQSVRHLPAAGKSGVLVDIDCGNGQLLGTAMQLGWEAWGR